MFPTYRKVVFKIDDKEVYATQGAHGCMWIGKPFDDLEFIDSGIYNLQHAEKKGKVPAGTLAACNIVAVENDNGRMKVFTEAQINEMREEARSIAKKHREEMAARKKAEDAKKAAANPATNPTADKAVIVIPKSKIKFGPKR